MVGWHHQLDGHECEQAAGVGDGQGMLPAIQVNHVAHHSSSTRVKILVTIAAVPHSTS